MTFNQHKIIVSFDLSTSWNMEDRRFGTHE